MIELREIKRQYGGVVALRSASLTLRAGEFHALLGTNGSGKSTLIKILAGSETPSGGHYEVDGRAVQVTSASYGRQLGVAVAYQDLSLIPSLSVEQNVALVLNDVRAARRVREARTRIAPLLKELNPDIDTSCRVSELKMSERYQLEIVKALAQRPKFLVMDEATAALDSEQVHSVFRLLDRFRESGLSLLFVSHRLDEVFEFCSRATILREGTTVEEIDLAHHSRDELLVLLSGQKNEVRQQEQNLARGKVNLEVFELAVSRDDKPISFTGYSGEIIGLGGLQGQGQREFLRALGLLAPRARGEVTVTPEHVPLQNRRGARRLAFFISGDRIEEGIFPRRPVYENTMAQHLALSGNVRLLSSGRLQKIVSPLLDRIKVVGSATQSIETLSGGNQQKVLLARLFRSTPAIILLDDPTMGVDPGSRQEIHEALRDLAKNGTAIVFYSSDDEELLALANRVFVFYEGSVVDELVGERLNYEEIVKASLHTDQLETVQ